METRDHSKNGASSKSQMSRGNFLRVNLILIAIISLTTFISCEKERFSPKNNDDIAKIKELLKDMDCERGLLVESKEGGYFDLLYLEKAIRTSNIYYCGQITTNVDALYREMGTVKSATYKDKRVVIKSTTRQCSTHGSVNVEVKWERTFYTKNRH